MTEVHPFLDGKPKRMLIDGKWLLSASGKTFDSFNPSTGEKLASVAEGDSVDIDLAVAAARRWPTIRTRTRWRLPDPMSPVSRSSVPLPAMMLVPSGSRGQSAVGISKRQSAIA